MNEKLKLDAVVPPDLAGIRLDRALARMFPDYSRSRIQVWIRDGAVTVDGNPTRPRDPVAGGEHIRVDAAFKILSEAQPQDIAIEVVHEDDSLIVVNKPAGLVVHPGAGQPDGTLQNALLHRFGELAGVPRAGIVHRLDKNTSGLLVVARTLQAHNALTAALKQHGVGRQYDAVCHGILSGGGTIDAPVGRHSADRKKMTVRDGGRPAATHYEVISRFRAHTHLRARLETGRTHQIRVHFSHLGHPLVGDRTYGARPRIPKRASDETVKLLQTFPRQALHASTLSLNHPVTGERLEWHAPVPDDLAKLISALQNDRDEHGD